MLGDLTAFAASFLILGEVIAAGALGIAPFYVVSRPSWTSVVVIAIARLTFANMAADSRRSAVNYLGAIDIRHSLFSRATV
jgi:hypothetical protein